MNDRQAGMVALGGTIGAGLFLGVGDGLRLAGAGMVILFAAAALLAWGVTRALGEIVIADGRGITFVDATSRFLGPGVARLQAWGYWSAAVLACATQLGAAAGILQGWLGSASWIGAAAALAILTILNRASARAVGAVESWLALLKVVTLAGFVVAGMIAASFLPLSQSRVTTPLLAFPMGAAGLLMALPLALFAFGNAELIGIVSADLEDPGRTLAPTIRRLMVRLALLNMGAAAALLVLQAAIAGHDPADNAFLAVLLRSGIPASATIMRIILLSVFTSSCNACLYGAASAFRTRPASQLTSRDIDQPGLLRRRAVLWTAASVTLVLLIGSLLPSGSFANILAGAALFGLVNWGIILMAHIRARRIAGRTAIASSSTLGGVSIAFLCIALQPDFSLAAIGTVICIAAVLFGGPMSRFARQANPERSQVPSPTQHP